MVEQKQVVNESTSVDKNAFTEKRMGTESVCGNYFNGQQEETGSGMANYYQLSASADPQSTPSQSEEEMVSNAGGSERNPSELDLRQHDQQKHQHSGSPRDPSSLAAGSNSWSISQQIQNHLTNNSTHQGTARSNWAFPSYHRIYNETQNGLAVAAAQQSEQTGSSQSHPQHHKSQMQHHGGSSSQHNNQHQHQYHQGHSQHHHHHQHQHQQQQHQMQSHQHSTQLTSTAGINGSSSGNPHGPQHLPKRFYYPSVFLFSGKSSNNKDICGDDKHKEDGDPWNVEAQAAFLGPNLWDKTLPYDSDLKVHQYADLDEFLSENGIPVDGLPSSHLGHSTSLTGRSDSLGHCAGLSLGLSQVTTKRERSPSPSDCMSPDTINPPSPADSIFDVAAFSMSSTTRDFDPRTRAFSDEELKPQPMIKKSRKQFVPDEMKDDKYWARRRKNNMAAKRSRDARRMKENQIALRAGYLEKENMNLHREVEQLKQENMELRARLSKYQEV
ncbi:myb-like protein Q isoform X2 [Toxorhynchites rutilus septentrionalis]|uniref:myb-like protein Q isoform X2 n=1 Tax=Toxorhynchites rutilus septentrionalis TaxID=329112 RepID=UPI00247AA9AF|nr:myb-like protein Q isoform X2 [Toxorhynchites rutilus septentrionalis]